MGCAEAEVSAKRGGGQRGGVGRAGSDAAAAAAAELGPNAEEASEIEAEIEAEIARCFDEPCAAAAVRKLTPP